jgi:RNase P protein component
MQGQSGGQRKRLSLGGPLGFSIGGKVRQAFERHLAKRATSMAAQSLHRDREVSA